MGLHYEISVEYEIQSTTQYMLDCQNWTLSKINLLPGKSTKYGSDRFKRIVTKKINFNDGFLEKNVFFNFYGEKSDFSTTNTSVEVEVDPKSSLGLDRFLMNVHPSFREILCIFTGKYPKIRIL